MMVELLADHTSMKVLQAADGARSSASICTSFHLAFIFPSPKARYNSSPPKARHGARMPFDFLLHSLADEYGKRAACVILSGTGADGSAG